ncbi:MAG: TIGR04086 family membrane protein [Ruminococcus sp.]|nr:TIGR04086 family membrane protein [Ruminococcus sp.]
MHRRHRTPWTARTSGMMIPALAGTLASAALTALLSAINYFFFDDMTMSAMLAAAACCAGSFAGAFFGGKYRRRRGIAEGAICGLLIYLMFSAAGLILTGSPAGIKKLLLLTVSGAAGGVCGVNSKRPKNLMD